ncbi:MAG TPA: hypothetical protein VGK95_09680 [Caldimonas sp.]|jgi:hypothetical protein
MPAAKPSARHCQAPHAGLAPIAMPLTTAVEEFGRRMAEAVPTAGLEDTAPRLHPIEERRARRAAWRGPDERGIFVNPHTRVCPFSIVHKL